MNKLTGFKIETLFVSIEHRIVFMDKYFTMKSTFFVLKLIKGIIIMMEGMYLRGKSKGDCYETADIYLVVS